MLCKIINYMGLVFRCIPIFCFYCMCWYLFAVRHSLTTAHSRLVNMQFFMWFHNGFCLLSTSSFYVNKL
ncbi:hypothetical protein HYC85_024440 [Camellia sinensis]|uniref:Uncharacterized protein n=1 Tax=Camellia sinensis TaxID=4442 RepID=A0A7J7GBY7_CAMSI|nr:hypothetical protein HYC85_024440 [Camellia sinensis]